MRTMRALFRYEAQNTLKMVASFYGAMFGTMAVMLLMSWGATPTPMQPKPARVWEEVVKG